MARDERDARGDVSLGEGYPCVSRNGNGGSDAGDDLIGYTLPAEELGLLTSPAEDEWVSSLEPYDAPALLGLFNQNLVDPLLGDTGLVRMLPNVDKFAYVFGKVESIIAY